MITRFLLLLCSFAFGGAVLSAQSGKAAGGEASASFQVMALNASPVLAELHYLRGTNDALPLKISPAHLSKPITLEQAGGNAITFAVKRAGADGKPSYVPVARADWPSGETKQALVFIAVSGSGASTQVRAVALDHGLKEFPARSLRVVNFSGAPIFGRFAGFQGEIAPGPARAVAYPVAPQSASAPTDAPRFPVTLGVVGPQGEPNILFNGWADAWPRARTLVVVSPGADAHRGRPKVRFVVDDLPPAAPAKG